MTNNITPSAIANTPWMRASGISSSIAKPVTAQAAPTNINTRFQIAMGLPLLRRMGA